MPAPPDPAVLANLFKHVAENPDSEEIRHALADTLEEHGRSQEAHAIRTMPENTLIHNGKVSLYHSRWHPGIHMDDEDYDEYANLLNEHGPEETANQLSGLLDYGDWTQTDGQDTPSWGSSDTAHGPYPVTWTNRHNSKTRHGNFYLYHNPRLGYIGVDLEHKIPIPLPDPSHTKLLGDGWDAMHDTYKQAKDFADAEVGVPHSIVPFRDNWHIMTAPDPDESGEEEPHQYAAYRAPTGGAVVRGTYYKGGKLIPDLEGDFANPPKQETPVMQYPQPKSSLRDRLKAKFSNKGPVTMKYARPVRYSADSMKKLFQEIESRQSSGSDTSSLHDLLADELNQNGRSDEASLIKSGKPFRVRIDDLGHRAVEPGSKFLTSDGYLLQPTEEGWTDGDGEWNATSDGRPADDTGLENEPLSGTYVPPSWNHGDPMPSFRKMSEGVKDFIDNDNEPEQYAKKEPLTVSFGRKKYARLPPEQLNALFDAVGKQPDSPELRHALADSLEQEGRTTEAKHLRDESKKIAIHRNGEERAIRVPRLNIASRRGFAGQARGTVITHEQLERQLAQGRTNRIGNNRTIERGPDGDIHVLLHGNHVVTVHPNGEYSLFTQGYHTPTTFAVHREVTGASPNRVRGRTMFQGQPFEEGVRFRPAPPAEWGRNYP